MRQLMERLEVLMESNNVDPKKYGVSSNPDKIKKALERAKAKWTPKGWVVKGDLDFYRLGLSQLPKMKFVGGKLELQTNNLKNLKGCPEKVGGDLDFHANYDLISLVGSPKVVGGDYNCSYNHKLKNLKGAPRNIGGSFFCDDCGLETLEGSPKFVPAIYSCSKNKLKNLKGAPEAVGVFFKCSNNELVSLEGAPKKIGEDFICINNTKQFTEEEVRAVSEVKGRIRVK